MPICSTAQRFGGYTRKLNWSKVCHPRSHLNSALRPAGHVPTSGRFPPCRTRCVWYFLGPGRIRSILDGAIAAWPGAWLGKNFREILETLGVDTARPWRELDEDTRQWILYTDETPIVTVLPVREAVRTQGPYEGKWESVSRYLRRTVAATQSEKNRARALRFFTASTCPTCHGHRLNPAALQVRYLDAAICELTHLNLDALLELLRRRYDHIVTRDPRDDGPEIGAERILLFTTLAILDAVTQLGLGGALIRGPPR